MGTGDNFLEIYIALFKNPKLDLKVKEIIKDTTVN